ncbi:MAG: DUF559 domain-containing protein [Solirubrobacteraceae bacterium]
MILAVAAQQHDVIVWDQLTALGLGRGAIEHRVRRGLLRPLHRRVFLCGRREPDTRARAAGALFAGGAHAVISHGDAAAVWEIRPPAEGPVHVTLVGGARVRHRGLRTHQARALHIADMRTLHGIPVTSPARTLLDIGAQLPAREFAAALEAAQIKRLVSKRHIDSTLDRSPRRPGAPALRALASEPLFTRSAAERRLAALLRAAELPRPAFNHVVEGLEVDAVWRPERVILEFDSYTFHASRAAFERDRRRDAILTRAGYLVLRTTWYELTKQSHALIARIATALARHAQPQPAASAGQ